LTRSKLPPQRGKAAPEKKKKEATKNVQQTEKTKGTPTVQQEEREKQEKKKRKETKKKKRKDTTSVGRSPLPSCRMNKGRKQPGQGEKKGKLCVTTTGGAAQPSFVLL
jgi:hypothetical protein